MPIEYEECWSVVRVLDPASPSGAPRDQEPEGVGFAAARFGRGGVYGPQWQVIGWLQDSATDYRSAFMHGASVKGTRSFAKDLFPAGFRRTAR